MELTKKIRVKPDSAVRNAVLSEYNHRCAICGRDRPQIHHIDENPSNNVPLNLLPLCPNHHLSDQHNPTTKIDPLRLALFREYKDPQILSPQFEPLFRRLRFLLEFTGKESLEEIESLIGDLWLFVLRLKMGKYYYGRVKVLELQRPGYSEADKKIVFAEFLERRNLHINSEKEKVVRLIVEMLRYQSWPQYDAQ